MDCPRWILHYRERDGLYEQVTERLDELGIPYRSEGGCDELVLLTPGGSFYGINALELIK